MEFNPSNPIIRLCLLGMDMESKGQTDDARKFFLQAWSEASNDFEKYLAAYFVARHQTNIDDKLKWLETALQFALRSDNDAVNSAFPALYSNIAACYDEKNDPDNANKYRALASSSVHEHKDKGPFYHGTRADLHVGDFLTAGSVSNYDTTVTMNHIYFTSLVNGAGLAAALAKGDGHERVYIVEPTGTFENDPNVTDKKFPGNPTRSYRSTAPLKIVGEVTDWVRQTPEDVKSWRAKLANVKGKIIN